MLVHRRTFLSGLFAAPAIVQISSIMPVRLWQPWYSWRLRAPKHPGYPGSSSAYDLLKDNEVIGLRLFNVDTLPDANVAGPKLMKQFGNGINLIDYREIDSYMLTKVYTINGDPFVDDLLMCGGPYKLLRTAPLV